MVVKDAELDFSSSCKYTTAMAIPQAHACMMESISSLYVVTLMLLIKGAPKAYSSHGDLFLNTEILMSFG